MMDTSFGTNECHYDTYGDWVAAVRMAALGKEGSFDGLTGGGRRRRSGPRTARKRDALRRHQDGLVLTGSRPCARRNRRDRDRRDGLSRGFHLLRGAGSPRAPGGVAALLA